MKQNRRFRSLKKGSALIAVVFFTVIMALLSGSMLNVTLTERRGNERARLILRARNMAENVAVYASEQLTTKLYRLRSASPMAFMTGSNAIYLPPDAVLTTQFSGPTDVEVRAGLTTTQPLALIDPADPANAGDPNAGLQVSRSSVPIVAKATMRHSSLGAVTSYAQQDLEIAMIPLFQFAVFYNMDMEFGPGPNMTISGPVHTNGNLIARIQTGFSNTLTFTERVTAAGGFFANTAHKGPTYMAAGNADNGPGGDGPLYFTAPSGTQTNIKNGSTWRDHKYGGSSVTATTLNQFKTFATSAYNGNLRTSVHGVTALQLPAIGGYKEVDDPSTPEDDRKNGRQIIEAPSASDPADIREAKIGRRAGLYIVANPTGTVRTGVLPNGTNLIVLGRSYRCFLNTVETNGTHTIMEVILPGQPSYGHNDNGTPGDYSDDTMYQNNLPNRYTDRTAIGVNQVLRIPASGRACDKFIGDTGSPNAAPPGITFANAGSLTGYKTTVTGTASFSNIPDHRFYDLRRATNNTGHPYNRGTYPYTPRTIRKIDFDLTRFKLAIERTLNGAVTSSAIFNPNAPSNTSPAYTSPGWDHAQWTNSIYNSAATTTTYKLGINYAAITDYSGFPTTATAAPNNYYADPFRIYFAPANPADPTITSDPNLFAVGATSLVNLFSPSPWFDGVTVYVHSVDAEVKDGSRSDSGVRLWHGRGPIVSLDPATYPGRTGFTFVTNDALYVVGHFNADGTVNSTTTSTGVGGYSGRYPETATERLASIMGDAITILSQPYMTRTGSSPNYSYYHSGGWGDSLSASRRDGSAAYSTSWQTSNPSSSNTVDGINTAIVPARLPNLSNTTDNPGAGTSVTAKFAPTQTEISSCLLTGIVPTTNSPAGAQTSGGVHNFPRLCENWAGTVGLYIRGSMVAMFQSQVATEPWSIRLYQGAIRHWGLHQSLRDAAHDVPLEPVVISAQRMRYRELSSGEYVAQKTAIEALPH